MPTCNTRVQQKIPQLAGDSLRVVLPFGLSAAPRVFTKVLKPALAALRAAGIRLVAYLDDFLTIRRSKEDVEAAFQKTMNLLRSLGFVINTEKSQTPGNSSNRVPGFHDQLQGNDIQAASGKNEANKSRMQKDSPERAGHSEKAGKNCGCASSYSAGSFTSPSALSSTTGPEKRRSSPPALIRINSVSECSESGKFAVVDQVPRQCK